MHSASKHAVKVGEVTFACVSLGSYLFLSFIGVDFRYDHLRTLVIPIELGLAAGVMAFMFLWMDHLAKVADEKYRRDHRR